MGDANEARWLRLADDLQIWRKVGCSTFLEYVERKLGHTPRAALERIRVACALAELPSIASALEHGELPFSAVRELTRVATLETEREWLRAAAGKTVHEIEKLISGHRRGDRPTDAPDPSVVAKVLRFDVKPSTAALLKQAKREIESQRGMKLDDDAFLAALAGIALQGGTADDEATISRAKFQVAVTRCEDCNRAWSDVAGAAAPMDASEIARASCDAQQLSRVDTGTPARAHQDVSPAVRRLVWRRDRGKCAVPGCRATAYLEIHHVHAREDGGSHESKNLILLCDGHHSALHGGSLTIRGEAPNRRHRRFGTRAEDRRRAPGGSRGFDVISFSDAATNRAAPAPPARSTPASDYSPWNSSRDVRDDGCSQSEDGSAVTRRTSCCSATAAKPTWV